MAKKKVIKKKSNEKKIIRQTQNLYYLFMEDVSVKELETLILDAFPVYREMIEIWTELNLMEIPMEHDSYVWEDAAEEFSAEEDQEYIKNHNVKKIYGISYDLQDQIAVDEIIKKVKERYELRICRDDEVL